ncbi:sensor histidine kinase [Dactylosporangium sp. NPDC050588]|uniref:sensor histidine kinase n=1 Tax=Dactylosporangium sp. NPDC050588 TaxID=3157211 RepID=UPI00340AA611
MTLIHQALLFDSPEQFLAAAVPFIVEGVHRGDTVLAVTSTRNTSLLHERLDAAADRVTFLEPSGWFDSPGRTLDAHHRRIDALAGDSAFLRVIGEPVWVGRDDLETSEWGRYESVVNVALADSRAWVMCGYDSSVLASTIVDDARRTHPRLAVGTASEISADFTEPASYYAAHNTPLTPYPATGVEWIPVHPDLAPVRQFVADHAPRLGVANDRIDDYVLAINEIATNVLRHGGGTGEARMWATDRRVICEITDSGTATGNFLGFLRAGPHSERGHGLWIARQICDLLEMRTGATGTTVRLHMRRAGF